LPNLALFFNELINPPLIIVGSNFAVEIIFATRDVVVVLPCDPVTIIFFFKAIIFFFIFIRSF